MNIVIGKLGKSIFFNNNNWGAVGGDNEPPMFYQNLFHKNPNINFYILGASDYGRLTEEQKAIVNKNNNVFDIYDNWKQWIKENKEIPQDERRIEYIEQRMKSLPTMDCGIIFAGPIATSINVNVKKFHNKNKLKTKTLLMFSNYTGPILHFLNLTNIPWTMIINDPRYNMNRKIIDVINAPKYILSQINETYNLKSAISYDDITLKTKTIDCKYSSMEKIFLINNKKNTDNKKDIKFMIICNEGLPSRYNDIKKYILDYIDDVDIYGKWNIRTIGEDKRFKGPKKFNELQQILPYIKYTFCIPIKKHWATAKFWEMANYGIVPFLHPLYDTQNNIKCPEFLRIKDEKDLYRKIEFLEQNPDKYKKLLKAIDNMLLDEYYNGKYLNDLTIKYVENMMK